MKFVAGLSSIRNWITELIKEASKLEVVYEESQNKFTGVLKQVEGEVRKYLETTVDSTAFMDESFDNLQQYSNSFNILPFIPVVVGMVVTHHALLTSLRVNMSHLPLKMFILLLESDATVMSGQMALLQYMTQQCIAIWEGQVKTVPAVRASSRNAEPNIESDHSYTVSWKLKPEESGMALSVQDKEEAHSSKDPGPPLPPPHVSSSMAALIVQFQQHCGSLS